MHRDDPTPLASPARGTRVADRVIRAPRGITRTAKSWLTEAALRMIQNNLDPEVAENPKELVVYGGIGRAARNWECFDAILAALRSLEDDESLLIQSGKPVGVFKTHVDAPRVLIANSNLVPKWATWDHFNELDRKGLMMFGQMTAGSWIYIGSQGIVQGTYESFAEAGRQHCGGQLSDKWILTAGLGGMGGAQPLAATMAGASMLAIECQQSRIDMRLATRYLDRQAKDLDDALGVDRAGDYPTGVDALEHRAGKRTRVRLEVPPGDPVLRWDHDRSLAQCVAQTRSELRQAVGLQPDEDDVGVGNGFDLVGRFRVDAEVAARAQHLHAALPHRLHVRTSCDQRHLGSTTRQRSTDVGTDRPRSEYGEPQASASSSRAATRRR